MPGELSGMEINFYEIHLVHINNGIYHPSIYRHLYRIRYEKEFRNKSLVKWLNIIRQRYRNVDVYHALYYHV